MVTKRQKQAAGLAAAALLLIGSAYAWQSNDKHRTNEMKDTLGVNDVTLVEDFKPITDWQAGDAVTQGIAVMNRLQDVAGNKAYVRIQIKEFLELTDNTENYSAKRYAIDTAGQFYKFDTLAEATAKAAEIGLAGVTPVQVAKTVFEGDDKYFIPTDAGGYNGQYGDFLLESLGNPDNPQQSIIDSTLTNQSAAAGSQHQTTPNDEDSYTVQKFDGTGTDLRTYSGANRINTFPTVATANNIADLKSYITWQFGSDVTTLADFDDTSETGQWVIDPSDGYVYWSQPLSPTETTPEFLTSVTLAKNFENASIYYAIHTTLEAVDKNDIATMAPPTKIQTAWGKAAETYAITFNANDGTGGSASPTSYTYNPSGTTTISLTSPTAPTDKAFDKWEITGGDTSLSGNTLTINAGSRAAITVKAIWKEENTAVSVPSTTPGSEFAFAGSQWRILDTDMDDDASNGLQALVIKVDKIGDSKFNDAAPTTLPYMKYYTATTGTNGYTDSASGGLKKTIDDWYTATIASDPALASKVNSVNLNLPDFAAFSSGITFSNGSTNTDWSWYGSATPYTATKNYEQDIRFKTTLDNTVDGAKQAFALSHGDIHTHMQLPVGDRTTSLLAFDGIDNTWLRSSGNVYYGAGVATAAGQLSPYQMSAVVAVHPALSLTIQ